MPSIFYTEFIPLAVVHLLAVIAPGPDFAITVSQTIRHGRRVGIATSLGIGLGISVHVVYTLMGVGALMLASPEIAIAARLLGAGYLTYLAIQLLRAKPKSDLVVTGIPIDDRPSFMRALCTGFLTNATNPKATLFFLSIFTTIVSPQTPLFLQTLYGVWMCSINALWFALVAVFFSNANIRGQFVRFGVWFERLMGLCLIGFALRLFLPAFTMEQK